MSEESARPDTLRVAPLQVGGLLAERLFKPGTVVLTSATLTLGGSFEPLARQWGLPQLGVSDRVAQAAVEPDAAIGRQCVTALTARMTASAGPASMSARRSTTAAARSSTSRGICRRPAATACPTRT